MPIATSSMVPNQIPRGQLARHLWRDFRMYAMKARQGMISKRNMALQDAPKGRTQQEREQQRSDITKIHERQYYLEMREEWATVLQSNGLQHEDWGAVSTQEAQAIRQVLGPEELEAEENNHEVESHHPPPPPPEFTPAGVAAQPMCRGVSHQSQQSYQTDSSYSSFSSDQNYYAAPSLSSRSQNTSSASYAFVDPRQFTNDDRDEYQNSFSSSSKGHAHAVGSEDEDGGGGVPVPSYKSWANVNPSQQQQQQQPPSAPPTHWSSSNPSSLSSSPADVPSSRSHHHHQLSSSLSSSSHFPPRVPSSLSKSISADDDTDRIFAAPPPAKAIISASSVAVTADNTAKPKSKPGSRYIGPQLAINDSENEADADFASMSRADQNAAYERFKLEARVQKIHEFHDEAAQYDTELARKMHELGNGQSRADKAFVAQLVTQHEQDMLQLRATKEEERRQLVRDERNRMTAEIEKGRGGGGGGGGVQHQSNTASKKGWATTIKGALKNGVASSTTTSSSSSSASNTANKTPVAPALHKPKTPATSSPSAFGPGPLNVNIDGLQNVLGYAPEVDLDTAFQMSQFLNSEGTDSQDSGTPQFRGMPNYYTPTATSTTPASTAAGGRQRKDSVSILDEPRFGPISASSANRRRGTITVSTAANEPIPTANGFWRPQPQPVEPSSPEEREALTDQYAKYFLGEAATARTSAGGAAAATHQAEEEEEDGWFNWGAKPAPAPPPPTQHAPPKANGGSKSTAGNGSAWTSKKPPTQAAAAAGGKSSPAIMMTPNGPGTSAKKSFGFGGGNTGEWGGWDQGRSSQEIGNHEEYEEVEQEEEQEEEEEQEQEHAHPSLFSAQQGKSSLLSNMMTKGKNVVAGAVGAAMGMGSPAPTLSHNTNPTGPTRRLGAQRTTTAPTPPPPPPAPTTNATATNKNTTKKGRAGANKKAPLATFDDFEELETQPQMMTTPRAPAGSTKFTSAFGFGSPPPPPPSARNAPAVGTGGMWDDMVSTTPKPAGLAGIFGGGGGSSTHNPSAGGGGTNSVRRPSGLHHQVWNAERGEREEEEEEEEQEDDQEEADVVEDEWSMPGSLNPQGGFSGFGGTKSAGKFGMGRSAGANVAAAAAKKGGSANNTNTWGWGPKSTPSANAAPSSTTKPKKGSALGGKRHATVVEEVPDEADGPWNRSPSNVLAPDSRIIMEPKPSKPPSMYEDIIQFGADAENIRNPPPTTNKRGGGGKGANQGEEVFDQEWFQRAAMQLRQGTEQGNRVFGEPGGGNGAKPVPPTNAGMNIPGRGSNNSANGLKSNSGWGGTPSSNMAGSMSGSFKDASPLANGPPPKMASQFGNNTNASKSSLNHAWGPGVPSSPKIGVGIGKNANVKAKPTISATTGLGWGATSSVFGNNTSAAADFDREDDSWGQGPRHDQDEWEEQNDDEERERQEELLRSKQRLQQMFSDSTSSGTKPSANGPTAGAGGAAAKARKLREQREREEREREEERERQEQEAREREEQEAQEREAQEKAAKEKEAKEKEAAAAKAAPPKPAVVKKGKGKKR